MSEIAKVFLDGADQSAHFHVASVDASEQLSRIYQFNLIVLSDRGDLSPETILGKPLGVELKLQDGAVRSFNGIITRMVRGPQKARRHEYWFEVRPDVALLEKRNDCRIFQNKSISDVFSAVAARIPSFTWEFAGSARTHLPWEYCVQYQETDLAFLMRLLEQEGIYFCFEHLAGGGTKMILLDDHAASYQRSRPALALAFNPNASATMRPQDYLEHWTRMSTMTSGALALSDFDFTKPMQAQDIRRSISSGHAWSDMDIYFYPGEFDSPQEGEAYAEFRMEALRCQYAQLKGCTTAPAIKAGNIVAVKGHPLPEMNGDFLVVSTSYAFHNRSMEAGAGEGADLRCEFTAIPAAIQFRPERTTPKSCILGPQTAFVVGPEKNEIHTDEYGRIRVMFYWDRYGKPNEDTSCWIRAAQPWANQGFGFWALPRVGSEVVVQFLDGDPDRPIVTGSVYNGENRLPYPQPGNKTRSGIRTLSTPRGGVNDYNELRFEDKKGEEEIYLQAQKDMNTRVKDNATRVVGGDDRLAVEKAQTIRIARQRQLTVEENQATAIGGDHHTAVGGNQGHRVEGARSAQVGADSLQIQGDAACSAGGDIGISAGQSYALNAQLGIAMSAQGTVDVQSGMTIAIHAGSGLSLQCGASFISLTPAGIFIQGPMLMLNSGGSALSAKAARPAKAKAVQKAAQAQAIKVADSPPVTPATLSPRAGALADAARTGAAFAETG